MARLEEALDRLRAGAHSTRGKGDLFERMILIALRDHPGVYGQRFKNLWLWADWPGRQQRQYTGDIGVDIVAEEHDGGLCAIQCKFYDRASVDIAEVNKFLADSGPDSETEWASRIFVATNPYTKVAEEKLRNTPNTTILTVPELDSWQLDWMSLLDNPNKADYQESKYRPRPDQQTAIDQVVHGLQNSGSRGRLLMPCGTGKSVVSLWITEKLCPVGSTVLYLVPSIALMDQTMQEWSKQRSINQHFLGVCSDSKVGKVDSEDISVMELPIPVTTNIEKITQQLQSRQSDALTVVFSTYQSLPNISAAISGLSDFVFDLIICDEAHRIACVDSKTNFDSQSGFRLIHDEEKVPARRRLFMTATQRIYKETVKDDDDRDVYSMDDENLFGPELYCMTFGEAVEQDLLTDYQVIAIGVSAKLYSSLSGRPINVPTGRIFTDDDIVRILGCYDALADPESLSLKRSDGTDTMREIGEFRGGVEEYCQRAIAYTRTVSKSKHIEEYFETIKQNYLLGHDIDQSQLLRLEVDHINGTMNAFERKRKLNWLRDNADKSSSDEQASARLLTNARCLVEGVDVPALDAVIFFDSKQSHVDIVQAVGRVMRKAPGKTIGYVILPVILEAGQSLDSPEVIANHPDFKQVFHVLNALRSHDERLDILMNSKKGHKKAPLRILARTTELAQQTDEYIQQILGSIRQNVWSIVVERYGDKRAWPNWGRRTALAYQRIRNHLQTKFNNQDDKGVHDCINDFTESMSKTITPTFTHEDALDMIAQYVVTLPVIEAFCLDVDFIQSNPVSSDLSKVIQKLEAKGVSISSYRNQLADIYQRIPLGLAEDSPAEKLNKLKEMYGGFFKAAVPDVVERQGIVYTPIEIVDFMLRSVDILLHQEFGHGIGAQNVTVLDPFTGTGTFPARLFTLRNKQGEYLIPDVNVAHKYNKEIKAYELMMLAYYIATLTIEVSAAERGIWRNQRDYQPFQGISLADTFLSWTDSMQRSRRQYIQLAFFDTDFLENSKRVHHQSDIPIKVIISNPPWSSGQKSAGDDNQRAENEEIADRVRQTFSQRQTELVGRAGGSALGDLYVQAFRWAMDRLAIKDENDNMINSDGIIAFLSPNSLTNATSLAGMRACLRDEFTSVYVINLRGDALKMGEAWKREGDKIFGSGSRLGCQITFLVRNAKKQKPASLHYAQVDDYSKLQAKYNWLAQLDVADNDAFQEIPFHPFHPFHPEHVPDDSYDNLLTVYDTNQKNTEVIFQNSPSGIKTNCDSYVYSFSRDALIEKVQRLIKVYERARTAFIEGSSIEECTMNTQLHSLKWTDKLKQSLKNECKIEFDVTHIREVYYRPFTKLWIYEDYRILTAGQAASNLFTPPPALLISTTGSTTFGILATRVIVDINHITPTRIITRR